MEVRLEEFFQLPEYSCPYIDDVIDWVENPNKSTFRRNLTKEQVIEALETIRKINEALRQRCIDLMFENRMKQYKLDSLKTVSEIGIKV